MIREVIGKKNKDYYFSNLAYSGLLISPEKRQVDATVAFVVLPRKLFSFFQEEKDHQFNALATCDIILLMDLNPRPANPPQPVCLGG